MVSARKKMIGRSVERNPIDAWMWEPKSSPRSTIVVFGGFHGDEPKSVSIARNLVELLRDNPALVGRSCWVVVPLLNPDGYARRRRRNVRKVDLTRNFPTTNWESSSRRSRMYGGPSPASEPETRAVIRVIDRYNPSRIVTIHSIGRERFCNNFDGPGKRIANAMSRRNGYPVTSSIGYATCGSFGTWSGVERGIATITLELPSLHSTKRCWEDNRDALLGIAAASARTE